MLIIDSSIYGLSHQRQKARLSGHIAKHMAHLEQGDIAATLDYVDRQ